VATRAGPTTLAASYAAPVWAGLPGPAPAPAPAPSHASTPSFPPLRHTGLPMNFPVDVVCTWVDGRDAAWREAAKAWYVKESGQHPNAGLVHSSMREPEPDPAQGKDELYYGVRSIAKFMPWVRTYYLVTQGPHVPSWWPDTGILDGLPVRIVHHADILPSGSGQDVLPTFNSNAIQSGIHRIPGLAEHFVLFDDDVFVGKPMRRSQFFSSSGQPVARMVPMVTSRLQRGNWRTICENIERLVKQLTGTPTVLAPAHVAVPVLKSWWAFVVDSAFPHVVASWRRFRSKHDFAIQYVVLGVLAAKRAVVPLPGTTLTEYFRAGQFAPWAKAHGFPHLFCINDRMDATDREALEEMLVTPKAGGHSPGPSPGLAPSRSWSRLR